VDRAARDGLEARLRSDLEAAGQRAESAEALARERALRIEQLQRRVRELERELADAERARTVVVVPVEADRIIGVEPRASARREWWRRA
jgi:hypothetical protein